MSNPYSSYLENRILSASPLELVKILYDEAIQAVRTARRHLREGRIAERSRCIGRAQAILLELASTVNLNEGGDIARRLVELYEYEVGRLNEANLLQQEKPLAEVEHLLTTVAEAWSTIAAKESGVDELRDAVVA